jgi:hypothetical protein
LDIPSSRTVREVPVLHKLPSLWYSVLTAQNWLRCWIYSKAQQFYFSTYAQVDACKGCSEVCKGKKLKI